jgi:hypothetical protein
MEALKKISIMLVVVSLFFSCNNSKPKIDDRPDENFVDEFKEREPIMEAERVAFLTRQLELTPDEAKLFWPLFDLYSGKKNELWKTQHLLLSKTRPCANVSKELAMETLDSLILVQELILGNDKEFTKKMLEILTPEKVLKLHHAEHRFKRHLLKQIRGKKEKR